MKKGFTLTEILVSMTIIGVVAMLMVPVMQNTQTKSLETATAHFHSMMSQAIKHYMADNEFETLFESPMAFHWQEAATKKEAAVKETEDFIYKYLQVAKVCTDREISKCYPEKVHSISGSKGTFEPIGQQNYGDKLKSFVLTNGAVIRMRPAILCSNGQGALRYCMPAGIQVDINGQKGPNTAGRDFWYISVYEDGILSDNIHWYMTQEEYREDIDAMNNEIEEKIKYNFDACYGNGNRSPHWQYGGGCFARFENNGFKFDY